ncbi:MAG: O-antigen/teichoic acid export membrane protein [Bradymonadia bacterium]
MSRNDAATAGRGFLVITAAKLWFMVGGVLINFGLPYVFGSSIYGDGADGKALYGQYIDLNNTLSILSMVMVTGVMQSVAKFIAERPDTPGGVTKQALKIMFGISSLVGGGFILAAPWIAEARSNPGLVNGYRAAGVILFCYGLYTVFIGTLNGRKQFFRQALYDIGFTTIKASLVLGFALIGLGVVGAFAGFATAAFIIMLLAMWRVSRHLPGGPKAEGFLPFALQVMLYTLVFNFIFKLDVLMLKPLVVDLYTPVSGWVPDGAPIFAWMKARTVEASSDGLVGVYGLALNISRIPWQATIAVTFVVFPMISESTFAADKERTHLYIRQTMRYSMILVAGAAVVLAAVPDAIIGLLPADFGAASIALAWLAPAYFFFSLFNLVNTLLMASGKASTALVIGVITAGLAAACYQLLLSDAQGTTEILERTGQATLIAFSAGLIMGLGALWKNYGPPLPLGTTIRVMSIGVSLVVAGRFIPPTGKIVTLVIAAGVGVVFLAALIITREFGAEDKARLMSILKRGG